MDDFGKLLQERYEYYMRKAYKSAAERGYPGKVKFADQYWRDMFDTYDELSYLYKRFKDGEDISMPDDILESDPPLIDRHKHEDSAPYR